MTAITVRTTAIEKRLYLPAAAVLSALLIAALLHRLTGGAGFPPIGRNVWLVIHLASVLPAVPLGAYVLVRRKGDRLHRLLGRFWALLMLATALSSFGLQGSGGLSPIHILSAVVLVSVPRAILQAVRGDIAGHRRGMTLTYAGLLIAGFFTFLPGRLMSDWLLGLA